MYNNNSGEMMMRRIALIGGGAAGLFCSIYLKELLGKEVEVLLLEKNERVGKKILITGNGRCNLSNNNMNYSFYNTSQVAYALRALSPDKLLDIFKKWGLLTRSDEEGRIYPYSQKATSVLDFLYQKALENGVIIKQFNVSHIKKTDHFLIYSALYQLENVDYTVLATGGLAGLSSNNGYALAQSLGHTVSNLSPGLVAIKTKENLKSLTGLRVKAKGQVIKDDLILACEVGEILFRDDGVSGILSFDLSRYLKKDLILSFDLVYNLQDDELRDFLGDDDSRLGGLLPKMLANEVKRRYQEEMKNDLVWYLRNFILHPVGVFGHQNAQITLGGVNINEIDPTTYASLKTENLYLIGEILDVDGACGGYNLHFAWASAYLSAQSIANKIQGESK